MFNEPGQVQVARKVSTSASDLLEQTPEECADRGVVSRWVL